MSISRWSITQRRPKEKAKKDPEAILKEMSDYNQKLREHDFSDTPKAKRAKRVRREIAMS